MLPCPNHNGAFDCTPFCFICEGEQEYEPTGFLECDFCDTMITDEAYAEEMGMCVECSNKYYSEEG